MALFGLTSKQWREQNPNLEGNIRDYTDLLHLVILNNLETINSELIKEKLSPKERLIRLNESARKQIKILADNKNMKELENLQTRVKDNELILIKDKL